MRKNTWESRSAAKRAETLDKIRPEWRLSPEDLERARQQRNITGHFIQQFLDEGDVSVTSMTSAPILKALGEGKLSAVQVTSAFCKRAAVAHQIVRLIHSFKSHHFLFVVVEQLPARSLLRSGTGAGQVSRRLFREA